ncbi:MAG: carboxypeptidase M32 [Micavibrio sp.]|nr:MAG: carboxypeptidase M32 [Micavibrio sp.]
MTETALQQASAATDTPRAYAALETHFTELAHLTRILGLLSWDRAVMMPKTGAQARGAQMAALTKIRHRKLTDPALGTLLNDATAEEDRLTDWQRGNLREIRRLYTRATAVPDDLAEALTKTANACETVWETAKPDSDFAAVAPLLSELLNLTRQSAAAIAETCGMAEPYDAMLDTYDKGARYQDIAPLFSALEDWLPDAVNTAIARQQESLPLGDPPPVEQQMALGQLLLDKMGYHGRFDTSSHPFSNGRGGDVRITTRFTGGPFTLECVLTVLHEAGHGLYDMQLPEEYDTQPVGGVFDLSMAVHESQAMVWERQIGQSLNFWKFLAAPSRKIFGIDAQNPAFTPENLYRQVNTVEKSFIRVEADEMTYPLHILLRTGLEKAMIDGDLSVKDLPAAWNDGMKDKFGIVPPDDRRGCLQDVHWYGGDFGYFPSYLLGAMNAAQIFQAMRRALPEVDTLIENGEFAPLREWLRDNIHARGCLDMPREVIRHATGDYLQLDNFKTHLSKRYLDA